MAEENTINNPVNSNSNETSPLQNFQNQAKPIDSTPIDQNNLNNTNTQNKEPNKLFSGNSSLLGMKASILKPQTAKEKQDYEKAIQKRLKKANGEPGSSWPFGLIIKAAAALAMVVLLCILYINNKDFLQKVGNKLAFLEKAQIAKPIEPLTPEILVLEDNVQIKITTPAGIDKATLIFADKKFNGKIMNKTVGGRTNTWEFILAGLKPGQYNFKCYTKNTKTNQVGFITGSFEVK